MNSIEEYQNLVNVLKQALQFYANTKNYTQNKNVNSTLFSQIEMDCGAQARFALDKINEREIMDKKIQDEYTELTDNMIKNIDDNSDNVEINNLLKAFNSLNNENIG